MPNKLSITFMLAPKITGNFAPAASRIISSNLIRNKKLNVFFKDDALYIYNDFINNKRYRNYFTESKMLESYDKLSKMNNKYSNQLYNFIKLPIGIYKDIIKSIETEYVIVSALSIFSFSFVTELLALNKKVILGGAVINTYKDIKDIRQYLLNIGANPNKLNDNLIIVHGFVDLHTDFYEIIKQWKDTYLPPADYSTIYDCDYDYLMESKLSPNIAVIPFSEGCYWGKCTYCDIFNGRDNNIEIFYNENLIKKIQNNINTIVKNYPNVNCLNLHENYLSLKTLKFINENIELPSTIRNIYAYTGVKFLTNKTYAKEFAKLSRNNSVGVYSLLGFDAINDFTLSQCQRGFTLKDIEKAIINICSNMNKCFNFSITMIKDLPIRNYKTVYSTNAYLYGIYNLLKEYTRVDFNINYLMMYPRSKMTESVINGSNKYMKLLNNPLDERASGIHYFLRHYLKDYHSMTDPVVNSLIPYYRVDEHNNLLPQDDEIEPFHGV